jgi:HSP20 family protein
MPMLSWDPFTTLSRLDRDFDELVRRTWGSPTTRPTAGFVPAVEMLTDGADVLVRLELPGLDVDKDVEIEVAEGRLTVSGTRSESSDRTLEDTKVLVREFRSGSFRREFALPDSVTAEDVEARYDRGILEIRVRHVAKPAVAPTKVQIKSSGPQVIEGAAE